jgi:hypothetical protein
MPREDVTDLDSRPLSCVVTAEQEERNRDAWRRAIDAGEQDYWREVLVADDDGDLRRCRYREGMIEGEARYGKPEWTQARITDDGRVFTRVRGDHPWRPWRPGRAPRPATNTRARGSRRSPGSRSASSRSRSTRAGPDDPDESDLERRFRARARILAAGRAS